MKKIVAIIALIAVLIAAWLGAAWHTGSSIEARSSEFVTRLNTAWAKNPTPGGMLQVKQVSHERGLISSHARFAFMMTGGPLGKDPLMEYDVTFSHGPFPLAALQRGQLLPQQFQAHIEMLTAGPLKMMAGALMGGKPPLVLDIGCSYGNHCTGTGSMPSIDADLGPISKNAKLAFGGVQFQFDVDHRSDTDYTASGDVRLLPLSIGGHDFGSGQIAVKSDAQSVDETITWKNGQGASKLTIALAATKPMSTLGEGAATLKPEELAKLIKSASARLELSKPMAVDMAARALNLTRGADLDAARQQMAAQLDAALTSDPETAKFIRTEGDLLISDWKYEGGKLSINGQERPELLELVKQSYLAQQSGAKQMPPAATGSAQASGDSDDDDDGDAGSDNGGASDVAPAPAPAPAPGAAAPVQAPGSSSGVVRAPPPAFSPGAAAPAQAPGGSSGVVRAPLGAGQAR